MATTEVTSSSAADKSSSGTYARRKLHPSYAGFICFPLTPTSGDDIGRYHQPAIDDMPSAYDELVTATAVTVTSAASSAAASAAVRRYAATSDVAIDLEDESILMTAAVKVANLTYTLLDAIGDHGAVSRGKYLFADGVSVRSDRSRGCLLLVSRRQMPISDLITPLGTWKIAGAIDTPDTIRERLCRHLSLTHISSDGDPEYDGLDVCMITAISPIPATPATPATPAAATTEELPHPTTNAVGSLSTRSLIFHPRWRATAAHNALKRRFDRYLAEWIHSGLISGSTIDDNMRVGRWLASHDYRGELHSILIAEGRWADMQSMLKGSKPRIMLKFLYQRGMRWTTS